VKKKQLSNSRSLSLIRRACILAPGRSSLAKEERSREELVALARAAPGMWADRDPDAYLVASRAGLEERDKALEDARLDV
jgi:hypothetical protein